MYMPMDWRAGEGMLTQKFDLICYSSKKKLSIIQMFTILYDYPIKGKVDWINASYYIVGASGIMSPAYDIKSYQFRAINNRRIDFR